MALFLQQGLLFIDIAKLRPTGTAKDKYKEFK